MDRGSRSQRSADGGSQSSSGRNSSSGSSRYKPLAPKEATARLPPRRSLSTTTEDITNSAPELTFLNISDPQQSKTQEARKLVRTQVMKNWSMEKRRQTEQTGKSTSEPVLSTKPGAESLLSVQRLLSTAVPRPSDVTMSQQPTSVSYHQPAARLNDRPLEIASGRGGSRNQSLPRTSGVIGSPAGAHSTFGWTAPQWAIETDGPDPQTGELIRHCYSLTFRASNPLYMISLLIERPSAPQYPLSIDIDHDDRIEQNASSADHTENVLFQLAQQSPALAHALLMVSASDLALRQINKQVNDHRVIHHKAKALYLLNEAISELAGVNYLVTLATIAVLASHELVVGDYKAWTVHIMGFSRTIDLNGGIRSLPSENLIRRLILWSDQIGALFMNMRPFFPAAEVLDPSSHIRNRYSRLLSEGPGTQSIPHPKIHDFYRKNNISQDLLEVLEDVHILAVLRADGNFKDARISDTRSLINLRDDILQRLIFLAPDTNEGDEDGSKEECIRLALLLLALNRLFSTKLPSAYFQITHMIADRLAAGLQQESFVDTWSQNEWVMIWVCFIGTSVSSNNPRTRNSFLHSAALISRHLFTGLDQLADELEQGLSRMVATGELFEDTEIGSFVAAVHTECGALAE